MAHRYQTVLFDLDGTLADTAPDLAYALNCVLKEQGKAELPYETIRPVVSHGGVALTRLGFDLAPEHPDFGPLRQRLLDIYRENVCRHTTLFPGMHEVLDYVERNGMNWGVVTNKPAWLTEPLMQALGLSQRAATIISGDSTQNRKPHPEPLLLACNQAGSQAQQCLYVGDHQRDIEAGHRAGMATLVALFGYIAEEDHPESWGADGMIENALEILDWIKHHSD